MLVPKKKKKEVIFCKIQMIEASHLFNFATGYSKDSTDLR